MHSSNIRFVASWISFWLSSRLVSSLPHLILKTLVYICYATKALITYPEKASLERATDILNALEEQIQREKPLTRIGFD